MSGRFSSDHSRSVSRSSQSQRQSGQGREGDSTHNHSGSQASNPNVFSDDYSLEPADSEQTTLTPRSPSISSIASSHTLRSNTLRSNTPRGATADKPRDDVDDNNNDVPLNELRTVENPFGDNARVSFDANRDGSPYRSSLPQKGVDAMQSNRNSMASVHSHTPSITQRSQSTSSRFSMPPRALSPYTGATGPSHPYAMYPQVGVSRSPSVTTTSTVRPMDRPLGDANAPQHPYAMYSQNVVLEEGMDGIDTPLDTPIAPAPIDPPVIPLGFPGLNPAYQRPPGRADDDVGDLIGPDGHTEQLPPYSRYPDGGGPKVVEDGYESVSDPGVPREALPNETQQGTQPMVNVSSGALALAPEQQQQQQQQQGTSLRDSGSGIGSGNESGNDIGRNDSPPTAAAVATGAGGGGAPVTGVMAFEEKLKSKGKKTACCGLPVWTLVLVIAVMVVAASIGGAIGGVLGARKAADDENATPKGPDIVTMTASPKSDATSISSIPSNLKTVPTGSYMVPADLKNQSKFCMADPDYKMAWSCQDQGYIPIEVDGSGSKHTVNFPSKPFDSSSFTYGAQTPVLNDPEQSLDLMMDTTDLSMGPALFFYALFDKLVILPQDTFSSNSVSKRGISESDILTNSLHRKELAQNGDKPWFCWWNGTIMEFFLYINESIKDYETDSSTATKFSLDHPGPTQTPSPREISKREPDLPDYPRRIKIGEKRDYPEAKAPYCQQMEVLGGGQIRTYSPATFQIQEIEPTPTTTLKGDRSATHQTYTAMAEYEKACYCVSLTD